MPKTKTQNRTKTATLNLRIDPELKDAAELAAAKDRRSLTSYVEKLLEDDLRARKVLRKNYISQGRHEFGND